MEIPIDDPFLNCRLDRKKDAEIFTNIVNNYRDGCTIALTGRWGSGKTTFLRMWEQYIRNNGQKVLYLNAWENDYIPEPLVCIIGELESVFPADRQEIIVKAAKEIFHILKKMPLALALDFVDRKIGSGTKDLIKETMSKRQDAVFENELSEYKIKKDGLTGFKSVLVNAVSSLDTENPVVFIIDELDRCRPDYAVEILEIIKHFFSVPGIVFILSIDKDQLANSVRGYYGSDRIDAEEYLRRFIDIEYSLPDNSEKILTFNQHDFNDEQCVTILEKLDSDKNTSRIKLTALTSRIDLLYGKVIS